MIEEEHIERVRTEGGITLMAASAVAVGLAVAVPVGIALFAVDVAAWGLQIAGKYARRGTGRAITWLIGQVRR